MAIKSFLMIFGFLFASTFVGVSTAFGGRKAQWMGPTAPAPAPESDDQAFVALNTKDPDVVEMAKFAVDEYNKERKTELNFSSVFTAAYTHSSKGVVYGLVIEAANATGVNNAYDANVLVNNDAMTLVAFWENKLYTIDG